MSDDGMTETLLQLAARRGEEYLAGVDDRPVRATATGDALRAALGGPLALAGEDPRRVIEALAAAGITGTVATQGPRYFGFVVGGSVPAATAADWLVSAWDQNAGIFVLSPIVSVIEQVTEAWLRELIGLPTTWTAGFVTGCQMASFTGLAIARHHVLAQAGWDVEAKGLAGVPPIDVVVGDEAHYTIFMALRLLGLGATPRRVPVDDQGRMKADDLATMLSETTGPCVVCAQAGNVNTGAFDPIAEIARATRSRGAWLHVDGAFGLWAVTSPALAPLVAGIDQADSIATDAHKWLNVPYDSGIVLTAHRESHRRALNLRAAYVVDSATERDPHEYVPDESRRGRVVPVYAALRTLGRDGLREMVERHCTLARRLADRLAVHPSVLILNDVVLNQVLVRFVPPEGGDADAFTRDVIASLQAEGTCWAGGTVWQGKAALRVSISNWKTQDDDIDRSAEAILAIVGDSR